MITGDHKLYFLLIDLKVINKFNVTAGIFLPLLQELVLSVNIFHANQHHYPLLKENQYNFMILIINLFVLIL